MAGGEYESKTFISFSHFISQFINSVIRAGLSITQFDEFDYDVGLSDVYDASHKRIRIDRQSILGCLFFRFYQIVVSI